MTTAARDAILTLIGEREDLALRQLQQNLEYLSVCRQQEKTEKIVQELLKQFEKPDRLAIQRHYEGELDKCDYEMKAIYLQGMHDCFELFDFLFGNDVYI